MADLAQHPRQRQATSAVLEMPSTRHGCLVEKIVPDQHAGQHPPVIVYQVLAHIDPRLPGLIQQAAAVAPGEAVEQVPLAACVAAQLLQAAGVTLQDTCRLPQQSEQRHTDQATQFMRQQTIKHTTQSSAMLPDVRLMQLL